MCWPALKGMLSFSLERAIGSKGIGATVSHFSRYQRKRYRGYFHQATSEIVEKKGLSERNGARAGFEPKSKIRNL